MAAQSSTPSSPISDDSYAVFKQDGSHQFYCRWTVEEDMLLAKAVADHGPHKWTLVSKLIPERTAVQCSTRWFGALNPNVHKGRWSKTEDEALTNAVRYFQTITPDDSSLPWNRIAENIPHRTGIQCQARWTEALDPTVKKGRWHPDEDKQLKVAIEKFGCCWIRVASMIPTRTQRQCRTRWNQIHSQSLKASCAVSRKSLALSNTKRKKSVPFTKYEFMLPTFPNGAFINIKQEECHNIQTINGDACIAISTSPKLEDVAMTEPCQTIMHPVSPASTRSSSFSSTSPISSISSFPYEASNIASYSENQSNEVRNLCTTSFDASEALEVNSFYNTNDSISSLLNNTDLDFLLSCLESQ